MVLGGCRSFLLLVTTIFENSFVHYGCPVGEKNFGEMNQTLDQLKLEFCALEKL